MIDCLLCFPSLPEAAQVGMALGFTTQDAETKAYETTQATLDMAICVIGEHFVPQPNDAEGNPVPPKGDGKWWTMVRYMKEKEDLPPGAWDAIQKYIVVPDENDPAIPKNKWA